MDDKTYQGLRSRPLEYFVLLMPKLGPSGIYDMAVRAMENQGQGLRLSLFNHPSVTRGGIVPDGIRRLAVLETLIQKLTDLNLTQGVEWTVGSGEDQGAVFGGIAHLPDSKVWEDDDNWIFGDNLQDVLVDMIRMVEPRYGYLPTEI